MLKYIAVIIALSAVVYSNSVRGEFVSDDIPTIVKNEKITQALTLPSLVSISNALIYKAARFDPKLYHLFNTALHILNSLLVFYFLLTFFKPVSSFAGALLFAVHPVHTEAVSWVSGKPYLFLTLFVLVSFMFYRYATAAGRDKKGRQIGAYILAVIFYGCALFSNFQAVLYPAMIMLYDIIYRRWKKWPLWLPYIFITLGFVFTKVFLIRERVNTLTADMHMTSAGNFLYNMVFSIFTHLKLVIWPLKLTFYHEPLSITRGLLISEALLLLLFLCFVPYLYKKAKPALFGIGIFIVFLAMTYSPVPLAWLIAERYVYMPSVGICMLAAFFMEKCVYVPRAREAAVVALVLITGFYSIRTILRNEDWKTRANLWRATIKTSPLSAKAHNNMGDIYSIEGSIKKAATAFKTATVLRPDYADAYFNLGLTYQKMGRNEEAVLNINKAVSLKPELKKLIRTSR